MTRHLVPKTTTARKMIFQKGCPRTMYGSSNHAQKILRSLRYLGMPKPVINSCSWCLKQSLSPTLLTLHPFVKHRLVQGTIHKDKENGEGKQILALSPALVGN